MQKQLLRNLCFVIAFGSMMVTVLSDCSCQQNNMRCVNETHFQICIENVELNDDVLYCGDGKICTSMGIGCIEENEFIPPSCPSGSSTNCKGCDGNVLFACTSRTTFTMCNGSTPGDQILSCPENKVCDINSGKYCVNECEVSSLECDRTAP